MHHHAAVRVRVRVSSTVGMLHHRSPSFAVVAADTAASFSQLRRRRRSPSTRRCQWAGTAIVGTVHQHQQQQLLLRKYSSSAQKEETTIAEPAPTNTNSQQHHDTTNHHHPQRRHVAHVRNFVPLGPLPYQYGWIWQHVVLQRRLEYLRRMQQNQVQLQQQQQQQQSNANGSSNSNNNNDCILLFEHQPVYTLGRGASVDHLTFLRKGNDHNAEEKEDDVLEDYRRRLCRTYRGNDASRLTCIDYSRQTNNGSIKTMAMSVEDEVTYLLQQQQHTPHPPPPVLAPNGAPIYRIERGGEVTFHGPGQLVLYPVLHLQHSSYQPDLHWYLHQIEEVIIQTLEYYNISSHRDTINTGVWVGTNKIAAVGVASSRWITSHGCALNVNPDLSYFGRDVITPCGIMAEGRGVTSIADILQERRRSQRRHNSNGNKSGIDSDDGHDYYDDEASDKCPTVEEVAQVASKCFAKVFQIELVLCGERGDNVIR